MASEVYSRKQTENRIVTSLKICFVRPYANGIDLCVCLPKRRSTLWIWLRWTSVLSAYDVDVFNGVLAEAEPDYMTFDDGGGGDDDDVACVQMS